MKIFFSLLRTFAVVLLVSGCYAARGFTLSLAAAQAPANQARVASIPIEIAGENYVLIQARINESQPLTFELDSGAGSGLVLYYKAAEALKFESQGKGKGRGAGGATFETSLIKGVSLNLSGVLMNNQTVVVFPPDRPPSNLGRNVDGVIGYSLFSRYVVEIDYLSRIVNLYEPATYQYTGGGEIIPITVQSKVPFARVQIPLMGRKPLDGKFIVDLGAARFALILNTPVVAANNLLAVPQKTITEPGAQGVGGEVKLIVGRLPSLQLGHFTFQNPVIHFAQDRKGALASSDYNGLLGGEVLRRFKMIFDYAHKRLILEPNASFTDSFEYDMSGIRLRAESADVKRWKVFRLVENSPAVEAGLREGDFVSAIDGRPAAELSLTEIVKMFKQDGRDYVLDIVRGEEKKQLKLKLRRLI